MLGYLESQPPPPPLQGILDHFTEKSTRRDSTNVYRTCHKLVYWEVSAVEPGPHSPEAQVDQMLPPAPGGQGSAAATAAAAVAAAATTGRAGTAGSSASSAGLGPANAAGLQALALALQLFPAAQGATGGAAASGAAAPAGYAQQTVAAGHLPHGLQPAVGTAPPPGPLTAAGLRAFPQPPRPSSAPVPAALPAPLQDFFQALLSASANTRNVRPRLDTQPPESLGGPPPGFGQGPRPAAVPISPAPMQPTSVTTPQPLPHPLPAPAATPHPSQPFQPAFPHSAPAAAAAAPQAAHHADPLLAITAGTAPPQHLTQGLNVPAAATGLAVLNPDTAMGGGAAAGTSNFHAHPPSTATPAFSLGFDGALSALFPASQLEHPFPAISEMQGFSNALALSDLHGRGAMLDAFHAYSSAAAPAAAGTAAGAAVEAAGHRSVEGGGDSAAEAESNPSRASMAAQQQRSGSEHPSLRGQQLQHHSPHVQPPGALPGLTPCCVLSPEQRQQLSVELMLAIQPLPDRLQQLCEGLQDPAAGRRRAAVQQHMAAVDQVLQKLDALGGVSVLQQLLRPSMDAVQQAIQPSGWSSESAAAGADGGGCTAPPRAGSDAAVAATAGIHASRQQPPTQPHLEPAGVVGAHGDAAAVTHAALLPGEEPYSPRVERSCALHWAVTPSIAACYDVSICYPVPSWPGLTAAAPGHMACEADGPGTGAGAEARAEMGVHAGVIVTEPQAAQTGLGEAACDVSGVAAGRDAAQATAQATGMSALVAGSDGRAAGAGPASGTDNPMQPAAGVQVAATPVSHGEACESRPCLPVHRVPTVLQLATLVALRRWAGDTAFEALLRTKDNFRANVLHRACRWGSVHCAC